MENATQVSVLQAKINEIQEYMKTNFGCDAKVEVNVHRADRETGSTLNENQASFVIGEISKDLGKPHNSKILETVGRGVMSIDNWDENYEISIYHDLEQKE